MFINFSKEIKSLFYNNKTACVLSVGLLLAFGNLAGRAITWIRQILVRQTLATTRKTDQVGNQSIQNKQEGKQGDQSTLHKKVETIQTSDQSVQESTVDRVKRLKLKYDSLISNNVVAEDDEIYITPERRVCAFGGCESEKMKRLVKKTKFITENEMIRIHPMKFLSNSPFIKKPNPRVNKFLETLEDESGWLSIVEATEKRAKAVAITKDGKHVILQQTAKSCVPTCVAMLLLDHGKQPNYEAIKETYLATCKQTVAWIKEASLDCRVTNLPDQNAVEILSKCLQEKGPGILSITHPSIRGHVVILDQISLEDNTCVIRDSFHGWMVTLKLDVLTSWLV